MIILYFYNNTWFICKVPCWCQSLVVNKLGQNIARYMRWICKVREDSSTEFFFLLFFLGWQSHRYGRPLVVAQIWALVGSIVSASWLHGIGGQILPRRAHRARAVWNCNRAARTAGHLFHCLGPLVGLWPGKHNASSSKMITSFFFSLQPMRSTTQAVNLKHTHKQSSRPQPCPLMLNIYAEILWEKNIFSWLKSS